MISSIYIFNNEIVKTYLTAPKAALPVRTKDKQLRLFTWGRRQNEPGALPLGGNLQLTDLRQGLYDKYFPKHCKIIISEYQLQRDIGNDWHSLTNKQFIHGIVLNEGQESRLYAITVTGREINNPFVLPRILFEA